MAKEVKKIVVVAAVGEIEDLRKQLTNLARKNKTSLVTAAEILGVSKQRLYAVLGSKKIYESQLQNVLKAIGASMDDIKF